MNQRKLISHGVTNSHCLVCFQSYFWISERVTLPVRAQEANPQ